MDKRSDILANAERVFEADGFRGSGVDSILQPSGISTRTLYKHFGSRDGLVLAVLEKRHRAFMTRLTSSEENPDPITQLFDVLEDWMTEHGSRGCMLLRAHGEYAGTHQEIAALVKRQKLEVQIEIARRIETILGRGDTELATQIWLLFEGATAIATVADTSIFTAAKRAARTLLTAAGAPP